MAWICDRTVTVRTDVAALDAVLAALSDSTRRAVYRRLRRSPGLTTGQLSELTRGMTRWGVMKHLAVLRQAGLVQTLHDGRNRRHYADAGRLQLVRDWLDEAAR